jgi:hypothetical protein
MQLAMAHGHPWVQDIVKYNMVDSMTRNYKRNPNEWTDVRNGRIGHVKKDIANNAAPEQMTGEWSGKLYTYDWSGKRIDSEENLKLTFKFDGNLLTMQWFMDDTLCSVYWAEKNGNEWIATKGRPYDPMLKTRWYVANSSYDIDTEKKSGKEVLYAGFTIYSIDTREPLMPQIAVLERIKN